MKVGRAGGLVLGVLAAGLGAGCAALQDPRGARTELVAMLDETDQTGRALNALTYGDLSGAERYALEALRVSPRDPYALYVAGMVYQATGRYDLARQYYEALIANRPQVTITTITQGTPQVRALVDVAQANLIVVNKLTGRYTARSTAQSGVIPEVRPEAFEPAPPLGAAGRGPIVAQALDAPGGGAAPPTLMREGGPQAEAEANVAGRFRILKRLLDEGLLTPEEYGRRRTTNLAALLPYSSATPPAEALGRPVPTDIQVVDRLRALGQTLETRAISPAEHSAERLAILDALLPAAPRRLDLPVLPPKDMMEAASAVGRVERMRERGLVSDDEARREKQAAEKLLDAQLARQSSGVSATGLRQGAAPAAAAPAKPKGKSSTGRSVSLAVAASREAAEAQWDKLKAKYPEELGGQSPSFVSEQGKKGVQWRVVAGPLASHAAANGLCKQLRLYRQSCTVVD